MILGPMYFAANDVKDNINIDDSRELGIHCGSIEQAEFFRRTRGYRNIYKLHLRPVRIIELDDNSSWVGRPTTDQILSKIPGDLDKQLRSVFVMTEYDKGDVIRKYLLKNGFDVIQYFNTQELQEFCYIILDTSLIRKIELVEE